MQDLFVSDFFDSPEVLECSTTNIPGSASSPVQVVSSLAKDTVGVQVKDGIQNVFIGLYVGASGSEALKCVISGPGDTTHPVTIPRGSRVSLKNMGTAAISSGSLAINFVSKASRDL